MTEADALDVTVAAGLVDASAVVDGDLRIVDTSRRNVSFHVMQDDGPSYVVKRGRGQDPFASVAREAQLYERLSAMPQLCASLPRLHAFDAGREILVLELVPGAEDLRAYHRRRGRFPRGYAAQVGRVLRTLHATPISDGLEGLVVSPPAGLFLDRPGVALLHDFSAAAADLVRLAQSFAGLRAQLGSLRGRWRHDALIHRDARWDNVLLTRSPTGRPAIKLVDWEGAGLGDPAWDVGSFMGDYVAFWAASVPVSPQGGARAHADLARYPLALMQPALRAFWHAYADAAGDTRDPALLHRSATYAGVRLLETALEHVRQAPEPTMTAATLAQVGVNMIDDPAAAARVILGIPAERTP